MNLSPHFTLAEFTASTIALRRGIDNTLPGELLSSAIETAGMMERIREHLWRVRGRECLIDVDSAYRCLLLNRALPSDDTSDHIKMAAVDFTSPDFGSPYEICRALAPVVSVLGIGQLIYEHTWVHVSRLPPEKVINRIITKQGRGYVAGIVPEVMAA